MREALYHRLETIIGREIVALDHSAKPSKLSVLDDQPDHVTVGGFPATKEVFACADFIG
jgi:hypothetical protein